METYSFMLHVCKLVHDFHEQLIFYIVYKYSVDQAKC